MFEASISFKIHFIAYLRSGIDDKSDIDPLQKLNCVICRLFVCVCLCVSAFHISIKSYLLGFSRKMVLHFHQ